MDLRRSGPPPARQHGEMETVADDLNQFPGHLLRRGQQVHTAMWSREVSPSTTSTQFAVLNALRQYDGIDQRTLGELLSLDRSTTAQIVRRLTTRGLVQEEREASDRRRKVLSVTPTGRDLARGMDALARAMSRRFLSVLTDEESRTLMGLLQKLIDEWQPTVDEASAPAARELD